MVKITSFAALATAAASLVAATTVYTGDVVNGRKVIKHLDVSDLPEGEVTELYFAAQQTTLGEDWHVPIIVAKGNADGKVIMLNSAVHGNELNNIRAVQRVFETIDVTKLNGTLVGLPTVNIPSVLRNSRYHYSTSVSDFQSDMNRLYPGNVNGSSSATRYAGELWEHVYMAEGGPAFFLDYHTMGIGNSFPLYCYADTRHPEVARAAELLAADVVGLDKAIPGKIRGNFDAEGIPAFTIEIGCPKTWQKDLIERTVNFTHRLLVEQGVLAPEDALSTPDDKDFQASAAKALWANSVDYVDAKFGGLVESLVELMDEVEEGQVIAKQYDAFGNVIDELTAPVSGRVLSTPVDPLREPGQTVFYIAHNSTDPDCLYGC